MWLKMKSEIDTMFVADMDLAKKHKVFSVPGIDFSTSGKSGPYIRLSFSFTDTKYLEKVGHAQSRIF